MQVWTCGCLYKINVCKYHKYIKPKKCIVHFHNRHLCALDFKLREEMGLGNCITSSGVWISVVLSSLISSKLFGRECPQVSVFEALLASIALLYLTLLKTKGQKDTLAHHVPSLQLWATSLSSCFWATGPEPCLGFNPC